MTENQTLAALTATNVSCACGCGQAPSKGRTFRPGHDARLVSHAVDAVVHTYNAAQYNLDPAVILDSPDIDIHDRITQTTANLQDLFGLPLAGKFENAAFRAWENENKRNEAIAAKAARREAAKANPPRTRSAAKITATDAPATKAEVGQIKIGRWFYDAERNADGSITYLTKTGERKNLGAQADSKVAETFVAK